MWFATLALTLSIWVFFDARQRNAAAILWSISAALLGPLVLPFYLAGRPLKGGEVREGGFGWQVFKNLALLWTVTVGLVAVTGFITVAGSGVTFRSEIQIAGIAVGFGVLTLGWLCILIGLAVIALLLKKSSILEMARDASAHPGGLQVTASGWVAWVASAGFLIMVTAAQMAYGLYNTPGRKLHRIEWDPPLVSAALQKNVKELRAFKGKSDELIGALEIALRHEHREAANLLLSYIPDRSDALVSAASNGHQHVILFLLANGVGVDSRNKYGSTALMRVRDTATADVLLSHGADVNAKDELGYSPLIEAVTDGNSDLVELLLERGADVNAAAGGMRPLDWSAHGENVPANFRIFGMLLDRGAKSSHSGTVFEANLRGWAAYKHFDEKYADEMLRIWSLHTQAR